MKAEISHRKSSPEQRRAHRPGARRRWFGVVSPQRSKATTRTRRSPRRSRSSRSPSSLRARRRADKGRSASALLATAMPPSLQMPIVLRQVQKSGETSKRHAWSRSHRLRRRRSRATTTFRSPSALPDGTRRFRRSCTGSASRRAPTVVASMPPAACSTCRRRLSPGGTLSPKSSRRRSGFRPSSTRARPCRWRIRRPTRPRPPMGPQNECRREQEHCPRVRPCGQGEAAEDHPRRPCRRPRPAPRLAGSEDSRRQRIEQ